MVNVRPKKRLGQHFLTDPAIASRIVSALVPGKLKVLELGPGKGILTRELLPDYGTDLKVIEIDDEAIKYLEVNFPDLHGRIIHDDFLHIDIGDLFQEPFALIGNFPYNISSQILFRIFENHDRIPLMVGMFQLEVARRIASPEGRKDYGILSVLLQAFFDIELLFTVGPGSFFPAPEVKSGVIRMSRNSRTELGVDDNLFKNLVKTGFNQRRKMLRNALSAYAFTHSAETEHYFTLRAEQLSPEDWIALTATVIPTHTQI